MIAHRPSSYPRLVTPEIPEDYEPHLDRVPIGVPGLDALVGGGLWRGSTTLVLGGTGTGKTTLGLQFALEGIKRGEGVLYVNFQENPVQLRRSIRNLGADPDRVYGEGFLRLYASPVELQIDSIIGAISDSVRQHAVRRVVVDALGDLAMASDFRRMADYLYALCQFFVVHGVTSILLVESDSVSSARAQQLPPISYVSDNVIVLSDTDVNPGRTLRVVKTRNSPHDTVAHPLQIDSNGVRVL